MSNIFNTWQIINLRHRLVHAYYKTYDPVVWSIVHEKLSGLEEEVANLLRARDMTPGEDAFE